jgi:hypothetical protein
MSGMNEICARITAGPRPAIWIRCVLDGAGGGPKLPEDR